MQGFFHGPLGKRALACLCREVLHQEPLLAELRQVWFDAAEADLDLRLLRFANAVHVDESFVDLGSRVEHLLGRVVQIPKLHLLLQLVVCARMVEVARLMHNDLTQFVGEDALVRVKEAQVGRHLQSGAVDELLQVELFVNLRLRLVHDLGVFGPLAAAE